MNLLDIRTILIGFVASDIICTLVISSLWLQHRRQSPELWLWTADFALQTVAILLIALRGFVPDVLSMVGGNMLGIAGTMLLFIGLERYLDRRGPQVHNWVMLAVFTAIHTYFATVRPILAVRNINLSAALLFICVQCAWLLLRRVEPRLRPATTFAGTVFSVYALISGVRIVESVVATTGNDYLRSGLFDALILLSYQMLFISLTLSLFLMVNRRLSGALQEDIARRERTEEELREDEQNYKNLADSGRALVWTAGTDKLCNYFNRVWLEFTGRSLEQELGNGWAEGVHPDDLQRCLDIYIGAFDRRDSFSMEYRLRRHDGEYRWILDDGSPRYNTKGQFIGYTGHCLDVTERKKAEESLRLSEERYRLSLEVTGQIGWSTPPDGAVEDMPMWRQYSGLSVEGVKGWKWLDSVHPDDRESVRQAWSSSVQNRDGYYSNEYRIRRADGVYRNFMVRSMPLLDADGSIKEWIGTCIDITDRKQAEEALAASHEALLEAQVIAHIGDWSMDTTTRTFVWSDEMYVIHGVKPRSSIPHETYLGLIHPEDRKRVFEVMGLAMAGKQQEFVVDYRIKRPDGSERFVSLTGKTILDSIGRVTGLHGTTQDITERKRVEAEKEAMQASLLQSKKLEAVGQLAGGVAHNFNNLLTGILGYIDIARMDTPPTSPVASSLDTARTAAVKAAGLARQLLAFGRNLVLLPTVQHASVAVESALDLVCSSVPSSVEVVRELSPDAWEVLADSSQITQVLLELINNAREAIKNEGAITVRTENVTVDEAYVATHPFARTGEFVIISVADTGPGIDPAMMPRLFEPFATTRQFGRGLGLPTVFGAINQARGWVAVQSEPGAGTTVGLYLPRQAEGPTPPA
ncbi:MAG: PAS domain-containing protein [Caldiserica bacterium]|nr:PAS domain-containing protein [Caldisericota bacterium]